VNKSMISWRYRAPNAASGQWVVRVRTSLWLPLVPHSHVGHPLEPVPGGGGGCVFVCGGIVGRHIHSGHLLSAWIEALEWLS